MVKLSDLIGLPFEWGGTGIKGFDCFTLVQEVSKRAGIIIPDQKTIRNKILRALAYEEAAENCCIKLNKPEPWCLVLFRMGTKDGTHIGVVLEDCMAFIHILKYRNVIIENLDFIYWQQHLKGFYRYVEA